VRNRGADCAGTSCVGRCGHVLCVGGGGGDGGRGQTGDHFCFYLSNLKTWFERCRDAGVVWVNPRFIHLDETRTCVAPA